MKTFEFWLPDAANSCKWKLAVVKMDICERGSPLTFLHAPRDSSVHLCSSWLCRPGCCDLQIVKCGVLGLLTNTWTFPFFHLSSPHSLHFPPLSLFFSPGYEGSNLNWTLINAFKTKGTKENKFVRNRKWHCKKGANAAEWGLHFRSCVCLVLDNWISVKYIYKC